MKTTIAVMAIMVISCAAQAQDAPSTTAPVPVEAPAPEATGAPVEAEPTALPVPPDTAPAARIADMFDPAPADKGQVIFYRPGGMGGMVGCMVREGEGVEERHLSKLTGNRYFVHQATPGKHDYWVKSEATDKLTMEIEPGETYFVRCKINMGLMVGRPNISPSELAEFEKYKAKLKPMKQEEMAEAAN